MVSASFELICIYRLRPFTFDRYRLRPFTLNKFQLRPFTLDRFQFRLFILESGSVSVSTIQSEAWIGIDFNYSLWNSTHRNEKKNERNKKYIYNLYIYYIYI
ncbi:unnamed protein product [Rhizophagus irregularis]|nr:unnamed protein product [Rhizophagus irregularis]